MLLDNELAFALAAAAREPRREFFLAAIRHLRVTWKEKNVPKRAFMISPVLCGHQCFLRTRGLSTGFGFDVTFKRCSRSASCVTTKPHVESFRRSTTICLRS